MNEIIDNIKEPIKDFKLLRSTFDWINNRHKYKFLPTNKIDGGEYVVVFKIDGKKYVFKYAIEESEAKELGYMKNDQPKN